MENKQYLVSRDNLRKSQSQADSWQEQCLLTQLQTDSTKEEHTNGRS